MARHLDQPLQTFTIGFDQAAYDERQFAAATAKALGATHHEEVVHVDKYDLLDDLLFELARHYGEPFADSSAIPTYCVSAVARANVKMVLSGDGGDELFAGYNTYPNILANMTVNGSGTWQRLRRRLSRTDGGLRARALAPATEHALEQHGLYYAHFNDDRRRRLYMTEVGEAIASRDQHQLVRQFFADAGRVECLSALQYLDIKTYLPGDILTKVDIAAMAHSLEVRVPLLDHQVVEFAATIPPELKLFAPDGALAQKYLLKRYVNTLVGGDAFTRPKQGFGVPIDSWFSADLCADLFDRVRSTLLDGGELLKRLFAREARAELVATPSAAFANAPRIWSLLFLQAWADVSDVAV
jgi:asparagine synthase (glutamine-hydrolysing)